MNVSLFAGLLLCFLPCKDIFDIVQFIFFCSFPMVRVCRSRVSIYFFFPDMPLIYFLFLPTRVSHVVCVLFFYLSSRVVLFADKASKLIYFTSTTFFFFLFIYLFCLRNLSLPWFCLFCHFSFAEQASKQKEKSGPLHSTLFVHQSHKFYFSGLCQTGTRVLFFFFYYLFFCFLVRSLSLSLSLAHRSPMYDMFGMAPCPVLAYPFLFSFSFSKRSRNGKVGKIINNHLVAQRRQRHSSTKSEHGNVYVFCFLFHSRNRCVIWKYGWVKDLSDVVSEKRWIGRPLGSSSSKTRGGYFWGWSWRRVVCCCVSVSMSVSM